MKISIVIPVFNEEKRIENTILEIIRYLNRQKYDYEIVIVDDGSTDNTRRVLQKLKENYQKIYLAHSIKNYGKGHAVKMGMNITTGELKLFMDADHSVKIDNLEKFIREIKNGCDIVIASIYLPGSKIISQIVWYKNILGKASRFFIKKFFLKNISDTQRGFKLFTREVAGEIFKRQTIDRFAFDIEIILIAERLKFKVKEIPVVWDNPFDSRVKLKDYFWALLDLGRAVWSIIFKVY